MCWVLISLFCHLHFTSHYANCKYLAYVILSRIPGSMMMFWSFTDDWVIVSTKQQLQLVCVTAVSLTLTSNACLCDLKTNYSHLCMSILFLLVWLQRSGEASATPYLSVWTSEELARDFGTLHLSVWPSDLSEWLSEELVSDSAHLCLSVWPSEELVRGSVNFY